MSHRMHYIGHVKKCGNRTQALIRHGFGMTFYRSVKQMNGQVDRSFKELVTKFTSPALQREGLKPVQ